MRILSIDTSSIASAALIDLDSADPSGTATVVADFATFDTRSHAEVLAPGVAGLFADPVAEGPELSAIVVGTGPGPFTGLRAGIAMARTLAFTWNVPLFGLMSLEALAQEFVQNSTAGGGSGRAGEFVVATDARRKEVYWAVFTAAGDLLQGPHVGTVSADLPEELSGPLEGRSIIGAGAGLYQDEFGEQGGIVVPEFAQSQPTAKELGLAAVRKLDVNAAPVLEVKDLFDGVLEADTTPLYLRESDAKVPGPRKKAL